MKINLFQLYCLIVSVSTMKSQQIAEIITDYFSDWKIRTLVLITCSLDDQLKWMKYLAAKDLSFYSGRGGLTKNCELNEYALRHTFTKLGVFVDYDCECARRAVIQVDTYNFTTEAISWLFWSAKTNPDQLELLELPLQFYNDVRFALQDAENVTIYDVYRIYDGMSNIAIQAGSWSVSSGLEWDLEDGKYTRRLSFQNATLRGGFAIVYFNGSDPDLFDTLRNYTKGRGEEALTRSSLSVWDVLQEMHGFRIDVVSITNTFGFTKNSDGILDGLAGQIQTKTVDVGITGLSMIDIRLPYTDFNSIPVWLFRSCFMFFQPRILEGSTLLIDPFRIEVWLASFLIMLMSSILMSVVAAYDSSLHVSTSSVVLFVTGVLSQQGAVLTSQWASGRLLLLTSLIFGYILNNYYSGQVVSELLAPTPSTIATTKQLLDSPLILTADVLTPFFKVRHKMENSHNIPELGFKMEKTGGFVTPKEGIEKVRSALYAYETEDNKGYELIDKTYTPAEICALGEVCLPDVEIYLAFKHPSPYKKVFSISVVIMNERGVLRRLNQLLKHPKPLCTGTNLIRPVDLENASFAFGVLLSGAAIGCLIFIVESLSSTRLFVRKRHSSIQSLLSSY